jgi:hypothetical protein
VGARGSPRRREINHGVVVRPVIVPSYGFYGPAYGWGLYDPLWYGPVVPYVVPAGVVTGGQRLEVTPKTAQVYVDGAFAGVIDDFNGHFQHLNLSPGGHRIDITAPGFQTLTFTPYVQADRTIDYKADMVPAVK